MRGVSIRRIDVSSNIHDLSEVLFQQNAVIFTNGTALFRLDNFNAKLSNFISEDVT